MNKSIYSLPLVGLTMGDPVGIGPEIVIKALSAEAAYAVCRPVVFGDAAVLKHELSALGLQRDIRVVEDVGKASADPGTIYVISCSRLDAQNIRYGQPTQQTSRAMAAYITRAVAAAREHSIDAVVTAPINKQCLHDAGYAYPGHTEMLAALTQTRDVVMMLAGSKLRVVPVTTHCPLSHVPRLLDPGAISTSIRITNRSLQSFFSIRRPRIAVAACNPHAGEQGLFGTEERDIIVPAVQTARSGGIDASGPHSSDTVFYRASKGAYDAVVCMYHDQALIPLKLLHFGNAVNITLGLPIIRTSVDHGTAYDIAGTGRAQEQSLLSALHLAADMSMARRRAS